MRMNLHFHSIALSLFFVNKSAARYSVRVLRRGLLIMFFCFWFYFAPDRLFFPFFFQSPRSRLVTMRLSIRTELLASGAQKISAQKNRVRLISSSSFFFSFSVRSFILCWEQNCARVRSLHFLWLWKTELGSFWIVHMSEADGFSSYRRPEKEKHQAAEWFVSRLRSPASKSTREDD